MLWKWLHFGIGWKLDWGTGGIFCVVDEDKQQQALSELILKIQNLNNLELN